MNLCKKLSTIIVESFFYEIVAKYRDKKVSISSQNK